MKKLISALIISLLMPMAVCAQDDMYFVPKKRTETEKNAPRKTRRENKDVYVVGNTYYSGIDKTDDEYNRRTKKKANKIYSCDDEAMYSPDSIASDVITFSTEETAERQQSKQRDTVYVFVTDKDDYRYCQYLSRFDDFYWYNRFYGPGWVSPWHRYWYVYDPWFSPWYDPWYDPWFSPWYDPWYYPYYAGRFYHYGMWGYPWGYAWGSPWECGWMYGYGGFYGYGGSAIGSYYPIGSGGHAISYNGSHNHHFSGSNSSAGKGFAHRTSSRTSNNYSVANRNGDVTNYTTGARGTGYTGTRYQNYVSNNDDNGYRNSYGNTSATPRYSGGGSMGGHSVGGHSVGGFGGHSGGSFGSGRR